MITFLQRKKKYLIMFLIFSLKLADIFNIARQLPKQKLKKDVFNKL